MARETQLTITGNLTADPELRFASAQVAKAPRGQRDMSPNAQAAHATQQQAGWGAPQGGSQNDPWATGNDRGPVPF